MSDRSGQNVIRCKICNLVQFDRGTSCRRCGSPFGRQKTLYLVGGHAFKEDALAQGSGSSQEFTFFVGGQLFEWDKRKADGNEIKHGVTFKDAATAFVDIRAKLIDDPDHSWDELRLILLGTSFDHRVLTVSHVERDTTIRLIGARLATKKERVFYEKEKS